jgi:predicted porin
MKHQHKVSRSLLAGAALLAAPVASQALEIQAGDWKFSFSGNVNVHYISSQCDDSTTFDVAAAGLAHACNAVGDQEDGVSTVSNGLLPAAFVFGASTTQKGWDIAATLGLYPGISTNDGGSPNLNGGAAAGNTALGTTGLDVRQVFMTFGNKDVGTFTLGRNFGLFGFDAIINDMTIPGVGVAGATAAAAPSNTSLGSIGLGYIYTDTLAQMNYTTPDLGGLKLTIGIFDPLEPIGGPDAGGAEAAPGFHGKAAFTAGNYYLSASFISQEHEGAANANDFDSFGFDIGGKASFGPVEVLGWFYDGKGMGTSVLFALPAVAGGEERDSDGFLAQVTYKAGDTKFGLNYGESNLDLADGEAASGLIAKNSKYTLGVYHALTPNLTLLAEFSDVESENHLNDDISSTNINVGAFFAF